MSQRGQALGRPSKEPGWKDPSLNTDAPSSSSSSSTSSSVVSTQPSPQLQSSSIPQSLQNSPSLSAVNTISAAASAAAAAAAAAAATIARATNTVSSSVSSSPGDSQRKAHGSAPDNKGQSTIVNENNLSSASSGGLGSLLGTRDSYQDLVAMERERELVRKFQRDARGVHGGGGGSLRSRNQSDISVGDSTSINHVSNVAVVQGATNGSSSHSVGSSSSGAHSVRDSLRDSGVGLVLASSGDYSTSTIRGGGGGSRGVGRSSESSSSTDSSLSTPVDVLLSNGSLQVGARGGGGGTPSDADSFGVAQTSRNTQASSTYEGHLHIPSGSFTVKSSTVATTSSSTSNLLNSTSANLYSPPFSQNPTAESDVGTSSGSSNGSLNNNQTPPSSMSGVPSFFDVALPLIRQGYTAMVDDSFTRCFKSKKIVYWNWNIYLFVAWILGVVVRYGILLPVRLAAFLCGFLIFFLTFPLVHIFKFALGEAREQQLKVLLIQFLASAFVASWHGVVRFHGIRPGSGSGGGKHRQGIFVANHSSMIDFIILLQSHPYAVVGQKHLGWVGFMQDKVLSALHCVWFNRGESEDKKTTAERMVKHIRDPSNARFPLLLFPEGTCVNNEYVIQFKKFVFELGVPIFPVAIKYNKVFVDAYWNSREQSFHYHLFRLMRSWAVVVDIWFLDPQMIRPGESGADFAMRVQHMIAARANLKPVAWDGYMKHYMPPPPRFIKVRQEAVAEELCYVTGVRDEGVALAVAAAEAVTLTARAAQHATVAAAKAAIEADASPVASQPLTSSQQPAATNTSSITTNNTTSVSPPPMQIPWSSAFKAIGGGLMGASPPSNSSTSIPEAATSSINAKLPQSSANAPESTLSPVSISESDGGGGGGSGSSQSFHSASEAVIPPVLVPSLSPSVPTDENKPSTMNTASTSSSSSLSSAPHNSTKRPPISPSHTTGLSSRGKNNASPGGRGGSKQRDRLSSSPTPRATSSSTTNGSITSPLVHLMSPPSPLMLKEGSPP